jgi:hypothetical protein
MSHRDKFRSSMASIPKDRWDAIFNKPPQQRPDLCEHCGYPLYMHDGEGQGCDKAFREQGVKACDPVSPND